MPVGEQGPETADQQIRFEVTADRALRSAAGLFGIDLQPQSAGGGGDGKWIFTSLDQLDSLIKKWSEIRDAIDDRRTRIERAQAIIRPLANDVMSRLHAHALKDSLDALEQHASGMHAYAKSYLDKLTTTRSEYVKVEGHNTKSLDDSGGG